MNKKASWQLIAMIILGIAFIGLLIISSSSSSIKTNYSYETEVSVSEKSKEIRIGTFEVTNSAILPKRVKLKELLVCTNQIFDFNSPINTNYRDIPTEKSYSGLFDSSYGDYIEIPLDTTAVAQITTNVGYLGDNLDEVTTFYIYEDDSNSYYYARDCDEIPKNQLVATIKVNQNG